MRAASSTQDFVEILPDRVATRAGRKTPDLRSQEGQEVQCLQIHFILFLVW
jgi:hypothetical protein